VSHSFRPPSERVAEAMTHQDQSKPPASSFTGAVRASSRSFRLSESITHDRLGIVTKNRRPVLPESRGYCPVSPDLARQDAAGLRQTNAPRRATYHTRSRRLARHLAGSGVLHPACILHSPLIQQRNSGAGHEGAAVGCLERLRLLVDGAPERSRDRGRDEVGTGAGECSLGAMEPACATDERALWSG
jgi:hypothetical protein